MSSSAAFALGIQLGCELVSAVGLMLNFGETTLSSSVVFALGTQLGCELVCIVDLVPKLGETVVSSSVAFALGVQLGCELVCVVGVVGLANLDDVLPKGPGLVGDPLGVVLTCRSGEGEAGDSGLRKGELRVGDDPYPSGEGLYAAGTDIVLNVGPILGTQRGENEQ